MMRKLAGTVVLALVVVGVSSAAPQDSANEKSPLLPAEQATVDVVSNAFFQGNSAAALKLLAPFVARLNDEKLQAVDAILSEREIPAVGELLADARLALLQQGFARQMPRASAQEAVLLLPELQKHLQEILNNADAQPVMADVLPTPDGIEEYEDLLWSVHVLNNQLTHARVIGEYMAALAKQVPRRQLAQLDQDELAIVQADYDALSETVGATQKELEEREIELRIQRLALAAEKLVVETISKEKFLAAYAWQNDAAVVADFFKAQAKSPNAPFVRTRLNDPQFIAQASANAAKAEQMAGDLSVKSHLLFLGLHWWMRGRYGMGPEVFGLAKTEAAKKSLAAQFPLYMPVQPPKPTNPLALDSQGPPVPLYDRRHHYWWAWEDRRVARSGFTNSQRTGTSETKSKTTYQVTTNRFY